MFCGIQMVASLQEMLINLIHNMLHVFGFSSFEITATLPKFHWLDIKLMQL